MLKQQRSRRAHRRALGRLRRRLRSPGQAVVWWRAASCSAPSTSPMAHSISDVMPVTNISARTCQAQQVPQIRSET